MNLLVTGSSGYVGKNVVRIAQARGYMVVEASRTKSAAPGTWVHYDLTSETDVRYDGPIDAIIHLAINTSQTADDGQEEKACKRLQDFAKTRNARFVFVSSQTANENAPTSYGRVKWNIEQSVLDSGGYVVRLGQVYGGEEKGLFRILVGVVRKLPFIPAFLPKPLIQPIHVEDCALGLVRISTKPDLPPKIYGLAEPNPQSFTVFMKAIAYHRLKVKRLSIPIPTFIVTLLSKLLGAKFADKSGLSRLQSLFDLKPMETANDLQMIKLPLRTLSVGMHKSGAGGRHLLIREGYTVLHYILKDKPPSVLVRRYVRVIEDLRSGNPMDLPRWASLGLYNSKAKFPELFWRLNAAIAIVEASSVGGPRFLGSRVKTSKIIALLKMGCAVLGHVLWTLLGLLMSPFVKALPLSGKT